jgi:hypothetical protein
LRLTKRVLATDFHPNADFLEILPMALLLHPAVFAVFVLRRGGIWGCHHHQADQAAAKNKSQSTHHRLLHLDKK